MGDPQVTAPPPLQVSGRALCALRMPTSPRGGASLPLGLRDRLSSMASSGLALRSGSCQRPICLLEWEESSFRPLTRGAGSSQVSGVPAFSSGNPGQPWSISSRRGSSRECGRGVGCCPLAPGLRVPLKGLRFHGLGVPREGVGGLADVGTDECCLPSSLRQPQALPPRQGWAAAQPAPGPCLMRVPPVPASG